MTATMLAATCRRYGSPEVAQVENVTTPTAGPGQIQVRVHSAGLNAADYRIRGANFPSGFALPARLAMGVLKPRKPILGTTFSGIVSAVGPDVTTHRVGDAVFGSAGQTHAQFLVMKADNAVSKPDSISHDDAASLPFGGCTAMHFLTRKANVAAGQRVLIIGASGAVGVAAVQLARHLGAHVTAVCSAANAELVTALGAHEVIDYRSRPVTQLVHDATRYDVVMDCVGSLTTPQGKQLLTPTGKYLIIAGTLWQNITARGQAVTGIALDSPADNARLAQLVTDGQMRAIIDSTYPLQDIAKAHARADTGHKVGNIVIHP